jgi:Zn-dependent protease
MMVAFDTLFLLLITGALAFVLYRLSTARELRRMMEMTAEEMAQGRLGPGNDYAITSESVVALLVGASCLVPLLGIPFIAGSLWALRRAREATPPDPRLVISRWFIRFAAGFTAAGAAVSIIAVAGLLTTAKGYRILPLLPQAVPADGASPFTVATAIAAVPAVILSITLHECGHGLVALGMGDDTALKAGRLTLNPLRHLDPFGSVLLPVVLVLLKVPFVFGWARPVPVRGMRLRDPALGSAAVAAAGAGANLLLALVGLGLFIALGVTLSWMMPGEVLNYSSLTAEPAVAGSSVHPLALTGYFLRILVILNLFLGLLNMIPFPPLDGSRLLEGLWPETFVPVYAALRPMGCLLLPVLLAAAAATLGALVLGVLWPLFHVFVPFFVRL